MKILKVEKGEIYDPKTSIFLARYESEETHMILYATKAGNFFIIDGEREDMDTRIQTCNRAYVEQWIEGKTLFVLDEFIQIFVTKKTPHPYDCPCCKEYLTAYVYYKDTLEVCAIITALTEEKLVTFYKEGIETIDTAYTHTPFFGVPGGLALHYEKISLHNLDSES